MVRHRLPPPAAPVPEQEHAARRGGDARHVRVHRAARARPAARSPAMKRSKTPGARSGSRQAELAWKSVWNKLDAAKSKQAMAFTEHYIGIWFRRW